MGTFSRLLAFLLAFVATGASVAACSSETADEESEGEEDLGGVSEDALTGGRRSLEINEDPSVLVEHPDTLVALEKKGLDLGLASRARSSSRHDELQRMSPEPIGRGLPHPR